MAEGRGWAAGRVVQLTSLQPKIRERGQKGRVHRQDTSRTELAVSDLPPPAKLTIPPNSLAPPKIVPQAGDPAYTLWGCGG